MVRTYVRKTKPENVLFGRAPMTKTGMTISLPLHDRIRAYQRILIATGAFDRDPSIAVTAGYLLMVGHELAQDTRVVDPPTPDDSAQITVHLPEKLLRDIRSAADLDRAFLITRLPSLVTLALDMIAAGIHPGFEPPESAEAASQ